MKIVIMEAITHLTNLALQKVGRASNLIWITFGDSRIVMNSKGLEREVAEYSLHIHCSWRWIADNKVCLASQDIYIPKSGVKEDHFDCNEIGTSRFDELAQEMNKIDSRVVTLVDTNEIGDLRMVFSDSTELNLFVDDSMGQEQWRLFSPYTDKEHIVVTSKGIEHK